MNVWGGIAGPLLIAEVGGNHEGDFEYALRLTNLATDSGIDYVKHQIYSGDGLVNPIEGQQRHEHFKKFELSPEQHIQLAKICEAKGVGYMASVWDLEAFEWIDEYLSIYKIGSGDLTAYPVIERVAKSGKPIILSTGLSNEEEVIESVNFIRSLNPIYQSNEKLALLQCTSMYPNPNSEAHLNVILTLKQKLGLEVGYSDHTEGVYALEIAYAMGAQILEFHFTDNREGKSFRDHKVSLTKHEVGELIERIRKINQLRGSSEKRLLEIEREHAISFRRALYLSQDIPANTIIDKSHIVCLRPNHGIDARCLKDLIGKKSVRELKKHQRLSWEDFV